MRAEPALVPEANCSTTKGSRPMASLSQACYVLPCLVTPLQWDLALSFSSVPTGEVGHLGGPSAQESLRGNEAKGNCLLAPSLSHAGSCGLLQSSGCYAALFIQGEPGREQERASSGPVATPSTCPDRRPAAQGCEAGAGPGQARRGAAPSLPSWTHWQHCLWRDHGSWIPPVTGVWPLDGEVRGDVSTKLFVGRGEWEGGSGHLKSLEGCQGPDLEQRPRVW